jgi:tetratricopeptide (TPR) repeat protein
MKTIKIFLASSEELKEERLQLADLVENLNHTLAKQDLHIQLVKWEYLDSSMGPKHKQEEYNEELRTCELCLVLYWTKFGMYTKKELDTAYHELCAGNNPKKLYVYFKDGSEITPDLKSFRDSFPDQYGHFFCHFENIDTLKADFLLQFMDYQSKTLKDSKFMEVKEGKVTIDGKEYVDLQNVPFAGNNEEYNNLQKLIKKNKKLLAVTEPDDPDYTEYATELQEQQEKLAKMESSLWDTALMITRLSTTKCSERLQRAMDLFNQGDNKGAQAILNEEEIEKDVQHNLNLIKLGEEGKKGLVINIEEYLLKVKTIKNSNEEKQTSKLVDLYLKVIIISEHLYGINDEHTATYYKELADLYRDLGYLDNALQYHTKALEIRTSLFGEEYLYSAESYDNIGSVYRDLGNHQKALELKIKAYEIRENLCGHVNPNVAYSLGNIAILYNDIMKHDKALTCARESMNILNEYFKGVDNLDIAHAASILGNCYISYNDYDNALCWKEKSLNIYKSLLKTEKHHRITDIYNDLGSIYGYKGDIQNALKYHKMCLDLYMKLHGKYHPSVSRAYMNVGIDLKKMGKYDEALDYEKTALEINETIFGPYSIKVIEVKKNLALLYRSLHNNDKIIETYQNIVDIYTHIEGVDTQLLLQAYYDLSWAYSNIDDFVNSKLYLEKGLELLDESSPQALASFYSRLGIANKQLKDNEKAIECFWNAAEFFYNLEDAENSFCNIREAAELGDIEAYDKLGEMYEFGEGVETDYSKAIEWYLKAANQGYEDSYNGLAWTYHLMGKYDDALPWAEKAVEVFPEDPDAIDTLATVYQDLGRYDEALEQYELCLKLLYNEQEEAEDDIREIEEKIATLKELIKNG